MAYKILLSLITIIKDKRLTIIQNEWKAILITGSTKEMFFQSIIRLQEQDKNFINKSCREINDSKHNTIKAWKEYGLER